MDSGLAQKEWAGANLPRMEGSERGRASNGVEPKEDGDSQVEILAFINWKRDRNLYKQNKITFHIVVHVSDSHFLFLFFFEVQQELPLLLFLSWVCQQRRTIILSPLLRSHHNLLIAPSSSPRLFFFLWIEGTHQSLVVAHVYSKPINDLKRSARLFCFCTGSSTRTTTLF